MDAKKMARAITTIEDTPQSVSRRESMYRMLQASQTVAGGDVPKLARPNQPVRAWGAHRARRFEPVVSGAVEGMFLPFDWKRIMFGAEMPTPDETAQLGWWVSDAQTCYSMLASVGGACVPRGGEYSDLQAVHVMLEGRTAPTDLERMITAAVTLEFVAAHVREAQVQGRALAAASVIWWGAGMVRMAERALQVAIRLDASWPLSGTMFAIIARRGRPSWMGKPVEAPQLPASERPRKRPRRARR